jgi:outer membrane protein TolC
MRGLVVLGFLCLGAQAWGEGEPLTLDHAFRAALRNHEGFRISEEALRRVRLLENKAWALLLPTLRVEGNFSIFDRENAFQIGTQRIVFREKNNYGGLGTFAMSLFDARSIPALQQARISIKSAEETTVFTQADLLFEVSRTFFGALAAQRLVEINGHALTINQEHLRDAKARLAAGEFIKLAVTRAEIEVVRAQRELIRAENALSSSLVALSFLTGLKNVSRLARPTLPTLPGVTAEALSNQALRSRRDLQAAVHEIQSAQKGIDVSWGNFVPTLSVVANSRAAPRVGFEQFVLNSQTIFTLGWTLFDGGTRYAELKEKRSLLRDAILKHSQLARSIERDVKLSFLELKTAEAALFASKKELELARENHAMVMARFRAGLATTIEAVDAANALAQAESSVLREELNRDTMRINLLRSVGADPIATLTTSVSRSTALPLFMAPVNAPVVGTAMIPGGGGQ